LEDKVKNLFALWNRHTDRLLDRKDK
jgi:hypothetical protein